MSQQTYRTILEVIEADGQLPPKPRGTKYAIKFVQPDWTTYNGYLWPFPGKWTPQISDEEWNDQTCVTGGVHVATTFVGAQSGGARATHCVVVAYRTSESGISDGGKIKVRRAKSLAAIDLYGAIRRRGREADLMGADLGGAYLTRADLAGADLRGADLGGADLGGADLGGADLGRAYLRGADLGRADLRGAYLRRADLGRAYLGFMDRENLKARGAFL